jgi:hypothetical protein
MHKYSDRQRPQFGMWVRSAAWGDRRSAFRRATRGKYPAVGACRAGRMGGRGRGAVADAGGSRGWSRRPTRSRQPAVSVPRAGHVRIPGGWWPAGQCSGPQILPRWPMSWSQTAWPRSSESASPSWYRRQIDQISGAYRSTRASHACMSPFPARVARAAAGGSSHRSQGADPLGSCGREPIAMS